MQGQSSNSRERCPRSGRNPGRHQPPRRENREPEGRRPEERVHTPGAYFFRLCEATPKSNEKLIRNRTEAKRFFESLMEFEEKSSLVHKLSLPGGEPPSLPRP